jgi:acyl-[acyl-carrier-protein]-phospholipid O-acyltransferase/long-chain-fatty-acid--[acyl-carrier-protein] ligase
MKVFDGPGMVADKADAPIIPIRLDGPQYTPFALRGKLRLRWFPKVTITVLPPRSFHIEGEMSARARRAIARRLYDEMSGMIFATSHTDPRCSAALAEARAIHGGKARVLEDVKREPLSYDRLLVGTPAGQALAAQTGEGEIVGLLPNINGAVVFFALQASAACPRC